MLITHQIGRLPNYTRHVATRCEFCGKTSSATFNWHHHKKMYRDIVLYACPECKRTGDGRVLVSPGVFEQYQEVER